MINAEEYGRALFLLSEEVGTADTVIAEIDEVSALIGENDGYARLLDTPALPKEERLRLIDEAFSAFDTHLVNTIKILCESRSVRLYDKLARAYHAAYDDARGIIRAEAVSAQPMTSEQITAMTKKLESMTKKRVILSNRVDPDILGGVRLSYSGIQIDGSLKTRLEGFKDSLRSLVL